MHARAMRLDHFAPIAWGAIALGAYLALAPRSPGGGDSSEFTLVLAAGGVSHPTGYPLYTLLGHGFVVFAHALGVGWAFAANAWSAVGAAVAVALLAALAQTWTDPGRDAGVAQRLLAGAAPVTFLALNPAWTAQATMAEVHSWHLAWVLGTALAYVALARALERPIAPRRLRVLAAAWGLLGGIGLSHHGSSVLVFAPLTLALLVSLGRRTHLALVACAVLGALLPLASYLHVAWAAWHPGPAVWASLQPTWRSVLDHLAGTQYRFYLGTFAPSPLDALLLARHVLPALVPWSVLLAFAPFVAADRAERRIVLAVAAAVTLELVFAFHYGVPDPTPYFLPPLALALCAVAPWLGALRPIRPRTRRVALAGVLALTVMGGLLSVPGAFAAVQRRLALDRFEQRVRRAWLEVPDGPAFVLWADDRVKRLQSYQLLAGERPQVAVLNPIVLLDDRVRMRFAMRFGFDPLHGVRVDPALVRNPSPQGPALDAYLHDLGDRLRSKTGLPVRVFRPS